MPTRHKRIAVVEDSRLRDAIDAVEAHFDDAPRGTIVRALAIRGSEALLRESDEDRTALEELVRLSTRRDDSIDWEVLARIDEQWGS